MFSESSRKVCRKGAKMPEKQAFLPQLDLTEIKTGARVEAQQR